MGAGWNQRLGNRTEQVAAARLQAMGYRVVAQRYRCRQGEVDLVAWDGETLVFCEVKARTQSLTGQPGEAISLRKQKRLVRCAEVFLQGHPEWQNRPCRFDAVLMVLEAGSWTTEVIVNAFCPGWW